MARQKKFASPSPLAPLIVSARSLIATDAAEQDFRQAFNLLNPATESEEINLLDESNRVALGEFLSLYCKTAFGLYYWGSDQDHRQFIDEPLDGGEKITLEFIRAIIGNERSPLTAEAKTEIQRELDRARFIKTQLDNLVRSSYQIIEASPDDDLINLAHNADVAIIKILETELLNSGEKQHALQVLARIINKMAMYLAIRNKKQEAQQIYTTLITKLITNNTRRNQDSYFPLEANEAGELESIGHPLYAVLDAKQFLANDFSERLALLNYFAGLDLKKLAFFTSPLVLKDCMAALSEVIETFCNDLKAGPNVAKSVATKLVRAHLGYDKPQEFKVFVLTAKEYFAAEVKALTAEPALYQKNDENYRYLVSLPDSLRPDNAQQLLDEALEKFARLQIDLQARLKRAASLPSSESDTASSEDEESSDYESDTESSKDEEPSDSESSESSSSSSSDESLREHRQSLKRLRPGEKKQNGPAAKKMRPASSSHASSSPASLFHRNSPDLRGISDALSAYAKTHPGTKVSCIIGDQKMDFTYFKPKRGPRSS